MALLGVPSEYEAWIVDSDTQEQIYRVPWKAISWQRVENNVSIGSVTVAEADGGRGCCGLLETLFPWTRMLRIDRNQQTVWDGPITGWGRPGISAGGARDVTVRAHDRSALMWKRIVFTTENVFGDPTSIAVALLDASGFGTAVDPYPFFVPLPVESAEDVLREYRADRVERIFDAVNELITATGLFYTQRTDTMFIDQNHVRQVLGGAGERPKLTERTTVDLPGFDVDGLNMTTVNYVGGASTGPSGFSRIGVSSLWAGEYLTATLESGRASSRSTRQYDVDVEAAIDATRSAAPTFTIEQTPLSPEFGNELMTADLGNLLPGCLLDVDYEDTCAFGVPFLDVGYVYRLWPCGPGPGVYRWLLTPLQSETVESVKIDQLDVNVTRDGGTKETVLLSAVPYAEWDGTLPAGWPCPPFEEISD